MATADEKRAKDAARQAAAQGIVADRERANARASGALGGLKLRSAGDLSRYNIGYTDDPNAAKPKAPTTSGGSSGASPTRPPTSTTTGATPPKRPTTRRISDGSRPVSGALYETNPTTRRPRGLPAGPTGTWTPDAAAAARGGRPGTLYEGRGDPYTGKTVAELQAPTRSRGPAAGSTGTWTAAAAAAAQGKAQKGALYEGRKAAETGSTAKQLKKRAGISTKKTTTSKPRAI
jgi:hypothetical protein